MHSLWNDIERYVKTLQTKTLLFLRLIPANQRYTSMSELERKASNSVFLISLAASFVDHRKDFYFVYAGLRVAYDLRMYSQVGIACILHGSAVVLLFRLYYYTTFILSLRGGTTKQSFFTIPDSIRVIVMDKIYCVYIMTNKNNTVLYTGITNDLRRRVYVHKERKVEGFTKKYNVTKLVYYEVFRDVRNAISREKQIKGGSRAKKIELINKMNAGWRDLYDDL